jgi:hypothetical protein
VISGQEDFEGEAPGGGRPGFGGMPNMSGMGGPAMQAQMAEAQRMVEQMIATVQRLLPPGTNPQTILYGLLGGFMLSVYLLGFFRALVFIALLLGGIIAYPQRYRHANVLAGRLTSLLGGRFTVPPKGALALAGVGVMLVLFWIFGGLFGGSSLNFSGSNSPGAGAIAQVSIKFYLNDSHARVIAAPK